jgi:hypothetical protein
MSGTGRAGGPPVAEKRPLRRRRVLLGGIVTFLEGAVHFDCTIRDLTEAGARITVPRNQPMPSHIHLINMRDRIAYESHVAWNTGREAGLTFRKTIPLETLNDPELAFLKTLWHDRSVR